MTSAKCLLTSKFSPTEGRLEATSFERLSGTRENAPHFLRTCVSAKSRRGRREAGVERDAQPRSPLDVGSRRLGGGGA